MQKISSKTISIVFSVLVVCFVVGSYIYGAWTEPTIAPPGGNVSAPINTGNIDQYKSGRFGAATSGVDTNYGLTIGYGEKITNAGASPTFYAEDQVSDPTPFIIDASGNVGIGDTTPASLLSVGSGDLFQVNSSGNIVKINNITYSWPSAQGAASTVLQNNGAGTLSWAAVAGGGITSISQGTGMTFSTTPITTTGTINLNTTGISACTNSATNKIYWDSAIGRLACGTDQSGSGSGTVNYLPKWSTATSLTNSIVYDNGTNVGVGTTSPDSNYRITTSVGGIKADSTSQPAGYFSSTLSYALITNSGNVGIGDTTPASLLSVGSGDLFQVNSSGNIVKINNITYSWPSAQGAASTVLRNNGAGTLSWAIPASGGITGVTAGTGLTGGGSSGNVTLTLANPTASTIGGVKAMACDAGQAVIGINTDGSVACGSGGGGLGPVNSYVITTTVSVSGYSTEIGDLSCNVGYGLSDLATTSGNAIYSMNMGGLGSSASLKIYGIGSTTTRSFSATCISGALSYTVNGRAYIPPTFSNDIKFLNCMTGYAPTGFTVTSGGNPTHSTSGTSITINLSGGTGLVSNYKATCTKI